MFKNEHMYQNFTTGTSELNLPIKFCGNQLTKFNKKNYPFNFRSKPHQTELDEG